jgi:hypothetical protein
MSVTIYSKAGHPVKMEDKKKRLKAWQQFYDRAEKRAGGDMLKLQRFCQMGERRVSALFKDSTRVNLPKNELEWTRLLKRFGFPIRIDQLDRQLFLVLLDDGSAHN